MAIADEVEDREGPKPQLLYTTGSRGSGAGERRVPGNPPDLRHGAGVGVPARYVSGDPTHEGDAASHAWSVRILTISGCRSHPDDPRLRHASIPHCYCSLDDAEANLIGGNCSGGGVETMTVKNQFPSGSNRKRTVEDTRPIALASAR